MDSEKNKPSVYSDYKDSLTLKEKKEIAEKLIIAFREQKLTYRQANDILAIVTETLSNASQRQNV